MSHIHFVGLRNIIVPVCMTICTCFVTFVGEFDFSSFSFKMKLFDAIRYSLQRKNLVTRADSLHAQACYHTMLRNDFEIMESSDVLHTGARCHYNIYSWFEFIDVLDIRR